LGAQPIKGSAVVAKVNGETITYDELWKECKEELQLKRAKDYWFEKRVLDQLIDQMVVAQAMKREGLSADEYDQKMIGDKVAEPTESELKSAYRLHMMHDPLAPSFDEAREGLIEQAKRKKRMGMRRKLISKLREKADVKVLQAGPGIEVEVEGWPSIGPDDAPITIVEFFDFTNPFSAASRKAIREYLGDSKDKVKFVYRDFPHEFNVYSERAHLAAHCARDQGRYFPYSKKLIEHRGRAKTDDLKRFAQELGLDMKTFNQCLSEKKHLDWLRKSMAKAKEKGVWDVPAFIINGQLLFGPQRPTAFREIIEGELERKK
jgi:protein-disulfide isomerase